MRKKVICIAVAVIILMTTALAEPWRRNRYQLIVIDSEGGINKMVGIIE